MEPENPEAPQTPPVEITPEAPVETPVVETGEVAGETPTEPTNIVQTDGFGTYHV